MKEQHGPKQYNDLDRLIDFLNENHKLYLSSKTSGSIVIADDQFVNQQGIRLNFEDIGLENRLEMFSNGGEVLNHF